MSKDFNSDMFSAILKANEKSMALLEKQLEDSQKQAKRKDIVFCAVFIIMCLLLAGSIWAYTQKKVAMNVDYGQGIEDTEIKDSSLTYNNAAES